VATIHVHLAGGGDDRSYDIHVGSGLLESVGSLVAAAGGRRAVVVADSAIADTHASRAAESLTAAGATVYPITVPSGEGSKSLAALGRIWDEMARLAVDRRTHVVAVGGGVVGDLAGFAAATFARGLALWHVPTTLVAQVDSAIGGKTGVNLAGGKNLVGAFWQPCGVVSDIDTLGTLPDREYLSGLAEVVKYGVILDEAFFCWLEAHAPDLVGRKTAAVTYAVERSAAIKAGVVESDEREVSGLRAALNYGHTFGHAFETALGYGTLLHGEAVSIGMGKAARLALSLGRIPGSLVERQDRLLNRLGLPHTTDGLADLDPDVLVDIMARDKKSEGGRLRFVLPTRLGAVELVGGIEPKLVRTILVGD
jgi:3-dehydroquinate synthase